MLERVHYNEQDCLDGFKDREFSYMSSKDTDESEKAKNNRNNDKWWLPTPKVPPDGLSVAGRKWLQSQKESVNQVHKAAMAINSQILSEMEIPENYIESLPKVIHTYIYGQSPRQSVLAQTELLATILYKFSYM